MNLLSLAHYTIFLMSIGFIVFILSKNPKAAGNRICAALVVCYAIWNFAYTFFQNAASKPDAMFWENIASLGWCSFPALSIWLSLILTLKKSLLKKWYFYPLLLFCPAFFIYQQWTGALIHDLVKRPQWWGVVWSHSIWPWLYFTYNYFFMTIALFLGAKFVKKTRLIATQKKGAKLVQLVTIITLILGTITDISLPLLKIHLIPPISSIILLILAGGMVYAISKYQFLILTPAYAASDILGAMGDSLILVGPDGKIIEVNTATLTLLGYSREELIHQPVEILFSSHDVSFFQEMVSHFQSKDGAFKDHRMFYRPKGGILIPVSFSGSVLRDPDHNLIGVIGVARDLRELLRLQANQRDYIVEKARAEALEERARELQEAYDRLRTIQAQLIQSEKMAAVGQLAGGMAHEINNPLGIILGFAQSIAKRIPETDPLFRPLKSIEREAVRCKKLVGDLLTFSRAGKTKAELIDINSAIEETLSLIEAQTKVKDIEIIKDYGTDLPQIIANKNQMQQVIMNLMNNAIDAIDASAVGDASAASDDIDAIDVTPGGRRFITIHTGNTETQIEIAVSDNGHGIPDDIRSHLFEPFFTTKEIGKGTGLGLSLCYEIIRKHHGVIEVESEVGKSSTFRIKLPINNNA